MGRAVAVLLAMGLSAGAAFAQAKGPCADIPDRFNALIKRYLDAASASIAEAEPAEALDAARKAARGGDHQATVIIAGIPMLFRPSKEMYRLSEIRQICTFAERNGLRVHVVTCAFFNALNPMGEVEMRRQAVERAFEQHRALPAGEADDDRKLDADMKALDACLLSNPS